MVQPAHNRLTFSGVFGTAALPQEIWSFSLKTGPQVFQDDVGRTQRAQQLRGLYVTHIRPLMRPHVVLTRVRLSQHDAGGLTSVNGDGGYNQADDTIPTAGTATAAPPMPLQTALVVSLSSGRAGVTGKGRFFLPWPAFGLADDFRLPDVDRDTIQTAVAAFLNGINALTVAAGDQDDLSVVSSKGYLSRVTGVRIGRAPDTMRSRRNALLESFDPPTAIGAD